MNTRIQELKQQAEEYASDQTNIVEEWQWIHEKKFAELIVQECITLAMDPQCFPKDHLTLVEAFKSGQEHSVRCIKQHFGVK
jgi:hypothetical protein